MGGFFVWSLKLLRIKIEGVKRVSDRELRVKTERMRSSVGLGSDYKKKR